MDNKWFQRELSACCVLQPCLGQMASMKQGRPAGFLEVVHTSGLVGGTRKHKFMGQVYSQVSLMVGLFLLYAWCTFPSHQHESCCFFTC